MGSARGSALKRDMKKLLMWLTAIAMLCGAAFCCAADKTPAEKDMAAYLLVYFKDDTHSLHFALSRDGYSFTDVNDGQPVIDGREIAEQKGIRDPYIIRGPDNVFYMAMTDLHIFAQDKGLRETRWQRDGHRYGWGNNRALVLMKSTDLVNWTHTNLRVDKAFPHLWDIGCSWAPEMTIDEKQGKIMLTFTMRFCNGRNKLYYTYMNGDFTKMEASPELLFEYPTNRSYIDGDIIKAGEEFHLFYVPHDGTPGIKHAASDSINSGYVYEAAYCDPEPKSCEAPNAWKRIGENKWVLMYDVYGTKVHNFGFVETTDFEHFTRLGKFNEGLMKATNFSSPKHGSVIHLTRAEADRLADHRGLIRSMPANSVASEYPKLILPGDYPDPTIVRDGEDYYMTHSPFLYTPGFLIWHSRDLVNWKPVCRAMTDVVGSAMAPDLIKHDGRFHIYFPAQKKNWVIWADDIRGPWSKPVRLEVGHIDPGHAVGEDGKRYLFLSAGHRIALSDDGLSVDGKLEKVYDGWEFPKEWVTEGKWLESPKILRKGDCFYMVSAEGGTAGPPTSHMVIVARSKSINGPWENSPYNPIVHTYRADEQWWSKGHGTVVDDAHGNWWIVYHAYENGYYPLGRQTLLEPIEWTDDGWFKAAGSAKPIRPSGAPVKGGMELSDDFDGEALGLQWMTWRDYAGITLEDGRLRLQARGRSPTDARLLLTTATDHAYEMQAEVTLAPGASGGLVLFYSDRAFAGIVSDGKEISVYENAEKSVRYPDSFGERFFVKIVNKANTCDLLASGDGKTWKTIRSGLDVSQMHHNKYRGFFALRPGLVAIGEGTVGFDNFEYAETVVSSQKSREADAPTVVIEVGAKGKAISPDLFGIFFEDLNYAADGGLYPEQVQNRSFEYSRGDNSDWHGLSYWRLLKSEEGAVEVAVEEAAPLNPNNPHYAVLAVERTGPRNGLLNEGFDGIVVKKDETYDVSLFARVLAGSPKRLAVRVETKKGELLGQTEFDGLETQWTKHMGSLAARADSADARLVVLVEGVGRIGLDMVSLFPRKTFKNRPNGLRADLARVIADLKPKFMRFPGGCLVHGDGLENMYRWKDTIGPLEQRKAQRNIWRYHQTLGFGYFEYFQFCEDIGAKPIPIVPAGVCCQNSGNYLDLVPKGQQGVPMEHMPAYVQEVLDLIEYANGSADSEWGSKRAAAGHPEPFGLKHLGVGNEDVISETFKVRYKMINDAVKAKYPEIVVIGTTGPFTDGRDYDEGWKFAREQNLPMVDEHGYKSPDWYWHNLARFDAYERGSALVYLGEYAAHERNRANTLRSALAEAAYMTGLERNGDLVRFSSYAPLLAKQRRSQWRPDLIYFDNTTVTPSINYYAQKLFSVNHGDAYLPTDVIRRGPGSSAPIRNGVMLGTWDTQAIFSDVRVTSGSGILLDETFANDARDWTEHGGDWRAGGRTCTQTSSARPALIRCPFTGGEAGYVLTLRAKKQSGSEGFLIGFNATDRDNYYWLNLGGWNNTVHRLEKSVDGRRAPVGPAVPGRIETGRWYDIQIGVNGSRIVCLLDGQRLIRFVDAPPDIAASTVRDSKTGDVIVKIVSRAETPMLAKIDLSALGSFTRKGRLTVLSGDAMAVNRFGQPPSVMSRTESLEVTPTTRYRVPPHSLSVLRFDPDKGRQTGR